MYMCAMEGRRRIDGPGVGYPVQACRVELQANPQLFMPETLCRVFNRRKPLIPYCQEKLLSLAYAYRTANQHR